MGIENNLPFVRRHAVARGRVVFSEGFLLERMSVLFLDRVTPEFIMDKVLDKAVGIPRYPEIMKTATDIQMVALQAMPPHGPGRWPLWIVGGHVGLFKAGKVFDSRRANDFYAAPDGARAT